MVRFRGFVASVLALSLVTPSLSFSPAPAKRPPLSSVVAVVSSSDATVPALVKGYVDRIARNQPLPDGIVFPLPNTSADEVRAGSGLLPQVLVSWLDPLTADTSGAAPRFGANNDFNAYFGDGWRSDWQGDVVGGPPQFRGSGTEGWLWTNHEYVSNSAPTKFSAPNGQQMTLARKLKELGILQNDVDTHKWETEDLDLYARQHKRQVGGSWYRVRFDPAARRWSVVRDAANLRYDATSNTLVTLTGQTLSARDHDDSGKPLEEGVVAGIMADCAGGQTPWGTVITAEETVQDAYGDFETAWTENGQFVAQAGFDPGGYISPYFAASPNADFGRTSKLFERHQLDGYGYLVEIDPGAPPGQAYRSVAQGGDGAGHRKIGSMGRAQWENAATVVGRDLRLLPGEPIVLYGGDDRRGGRIYKLVTRRPYQPAMTRAQVRALLDEGDLYVAHFADLDNTTGITVRGGEVPTEAKPGRGRWIHLSTSSADLTPNAEALGKKGTPVGTALRDTAWNGIAGFRDDNDVRLALYTVSNKLGIRELNRPEDLEWNARDASGTPRLYISFTNHGRQVALDETGRRFEADRHAAASPRREDRDGAIFALVEKDPARPAVSRELQFFQVWRGSRGTGPFDASSPDNLLLDADGGVWFCTDGNMGRNKTSDALYYLDLDPRHDPRQASGPAGGTYGKAFRVVALPSDAEATGPAFSSDQKTLFLSVQHPGENLPSEWPPRP